MNECIFKDVKKKEMIKLKKHFKLPLRNVIYGYQLINEFGKKKKNYIHGNFANYYYERYKKRKKEHLEINENKSDSSNNFTRTLCHYEEDKESKFLEDDRLKQIDKLIKNIFKDKNVLDIGCNIGITTFLLSLKYKCKVVNGIDIDYSLINKNVHLLKLFMEFVLLYNAERHMLPYFLNHKKLLRIEKHVFLDIFQLFEQTNENACLKNREKLEINENNGHDSDKKNQEKDEKNQKECENLIENYCFPCNIYFMCANIFDKKFQKVRNKYDVIICFSVLKWIHLNYGDTSVIDLFDIIYNMLKTEGYFIVEHHNEIRYKLKKFEKKNYTHNIKLNYNDFQRFICKTDETGASRMKLIHEVDSFNSTNSAEEANPKIKEREKEIKKRKRGMFNRTIYIYQKN